MPLGVKTGGFFLRDVSGGIYGGFGGFLREASGGRLLKKPEQNFYIFAKLALLPWHGFLFLKVQL